MPKKTLHEDWIAVIIAFITIGLVCLGLRPMLPKIASWNNMDTLGVQLGNSGLWINTAYLFVWVFLSLVVARLLVGNFSWGKLIPSLLAIIVISLIAQVVAGNKTIKGFGIEVVLFSLILGLFISNVLGVPEWLKPAIQTELFIKIGLVLLGSNVIFRDILEAGGLGILQSVAVVFTVWYFSFWVCRKLKLDDEFRMMISSAVSICGVSAAIATSGAIEGDNKKLSHVISLVLIVAIPMMLFMPYIAIWANMPPAVAGAWLGGTIDTSGAVVAAGTMLGEEALKYATLVKFSQNVLLGLAAFFISLYWSYSRKEAGYEKPTLGTIWERFPKFVLGFVLASLLFSFVLPAPVVTAAKGPLKELQTYWFALAFTCIGLETKFTDIFKMDNGRPALAFIIAQVFNVIFTLVIAYLVFGTNERHQANHVPHNQSKYKASFSAGSTLAVFGDSFGEGVGAAPRNPNGFSFQLNLTLQPSRFYNLYANGKGVYHMLQNAYDSLPPGKIGSYIVTLVGLNDIRQNVPDSVLYETIENEYRAFYIHSMLDTAIEFSSPEIIKTGTTTLVTPLCASKAKRIQEGGKAINLADRASVTYHFIGNNIAVGYFVSPNAGSFKVEIDGKVVDTVRPSRKAGGIFTPSDVYPTSKVYGELTSNSHTVRITNLLDTTKLDYLGIMRQPQEVLTQVLSGEIPYMPDAIYAKNVPAGYGYATKGRSDTASGIIRKLIQNEFKDYPIYFVPLNNFYTLSSGVSIDGVHPNNTGHQQINNAFLEYIKKNGYGSTEASKR